jgi:hypothetical protein
MYLALKGWRASAARAISIRAKGLRHGLYTAVHHCLRVLTMTEQCNITVIAAGSEGFFGQGDPNQGKNPQAWASQTGQNFVDDNRHMDFAVAHAWPDNWEM